MSKILAIAGRELRSYFVSPLAYVVAAFFMVTMFAGMLFMHAPGPQGNHKLALTVILGSATALVASLYAWFLTPLEEPHH